MLTINEAELREFFLSCIDAGLHAINKNKFNKVFVVIPINVTLYSTMVVACNANSNGRFSIVPPMTFSMPAVLPEVCDLCMEIEVASPFLRDPQYTGYNINSETTANNLLRQTQIHDLLLKHFPFLEVYLKPADYYFQKLKFDHELQTLKAEHKNLREEVMVLRKENQCFAQEMQNIKNIFQRFVTEYPQVHSLPSSPPITGPFFVQTSEATPQQIDIEQLPQNAEEQAIRASSKRKLGP